MATKPIVRHGSIYISVLGVSVLVLVIGLGAVIVGRVQARTAATANDFAEARICARSGLELAMLAVYNDPYWRRNRGNGVWFSATPSGMGAFSVSASDPTDADVTIGENNPVILTSTGTKGSARYILSMRMEVGPRTGSCLEASMCSGKDLTVAGATLGSDQTIRSNTTVSATGGATVTASVEACTDILGATYAGTKTITGLTSTLPDPATVLDYYTANGTAIPYSALRQADAELIANGSFEISTSGWYAQSGCTLSRNLLLMKDGLASLRVSNRDSINDAAATDLPVSRMVSGHAYTLLCPVYSARAATMRVRITFTTTNGATSIVSALTPVPQNTWTNLEGSFPAVTWTGTLTQVTLSVESNAPTSDYTIDAVSFRDTTHGAAYLLEGLLAPGVNPYGAPNARGIYVINCGGRNVIVTDTRIVGTLVMLNPGASSSLLGAVCMEAAAANLPAFMTDGKVLIRLSSTGLSESSLGMNLNPPGSPYPYQAGAGTFTNATATDSYPTSISGLVYAKDDLTIDGNTTINGVVVGNGAITVGSTSLTLRYNNFYLNNPPPGFTRGTVVMKPVPGTWQRVAN